MTLPIPRDTGISFLTTARPLPGAITEIFGDRSSGRTSLALAEAAGATQEGQVCAWVDASDALDVDSAARAGVVLENLIWVRCGGNLRSAMKAADLLLHGGGFGIVALDLADAAPAELRRIPLSYWYRFRLAIEHTQTALVVLTAEPQARNTSALTLEMRQDEAVWSGTSTDFQLLRALRFEMNCRRGQFAASKGQAVA